VRDVSTPGRSDRHSVFVPTSPHNHPIAAPTGSRCGSCGGRLYLEAEGAVTAAQAAYLAAARKGLIQDLDPATM
jgi:hypothetical protein